MRRLLSFSFAALTAACTGASASGIAAAGPHFHLEKRLALPSVTGWDYLSIDPEGRQLFISDNAGVLVVDIDRLRVIGRAPRGAHLRTVGMVHGVAVASSLKRGFISIEQPASVTAFDLRSRRQLFIARTDPGADAIVHDSTTNRVFTFNGKQAGIHNATAIDGRSGKHLAEIPLPGRPEAAVSDGLGNIYANIADRNELVRIDTNTLKVTATWPIANCTEPSALAIDAKRRRLFAACDNQRLVMIDAVSGAELASVHSGEGTDAATFDPGSDDLFASNGEGTLTIAHEGSTSLEPVATVRTGPEARTMALDPITHRIFLLSGRFNADGTKSADNPHGYPLARKGSVRLLVVGP